jgi:hypothetical protein
MRRFSLAVLFLSLPALPARTQVVTEMTPQQIDQAIALGVDQKPGPYTLRTKQFWMEFTTPFLRVSERAASAPSVDRSLATPDLIAPELRIVAAAEPLGDKVPAVTKVVVERPDGTTVAPRSQESFVDYAQSTRRKKIEIRGVRAVFPIAVLEPGARFRFQLSDGSQQLLAPDPSWFKTPR